VSVRSKSVGQGLAAVGLGAFIIVGVVSSLSNATGLLAFTAYSVVGSVLVVRRPRHLIGWLLVLLAGGFSVVGRGPDVTATLIETPWADWLPALAWLGTMAAIGIFLGLSVLTATFPTGRLPTGGVGRASRASLALIAGIAVLQAVDPIFVSRLPDGTPLELRNPIGLAPAWAGWDFMDGPAYMVVMGAILVCTLGLLVRFRRAGAVEREQDKWFLASLAVIVAAVTFGYVAVSLLDPGGTWAWIPAVFAFPLPALAIGIAITRYRLYDIDRIISRTISYAGVTLVLFGVFAGVNLTVRSVLDPVVGGGPVGVAASTLAMAALFSPLRTRFQRVVDRRFNRGRAAVDVITERFAGRLRDELDPAAIGLALRTAAVASVQPAAARIWLRHAKGAPGSI
jgi:hypothetical protein